MSTSLERIMYRILDKTVVEKTIWVPDSWPYLSCNQLTNQDYHKRARTSEHKFSINLKSPCNHSSQLAPWATFWYGGTFPPLASTCALLVLDWVLPRGFKSLLSGEGTFFSSPNIWVFQSTRWVHKHARDVATKEDLTVRSNGLVFFELQILRGQFVLCGSK